MPGLDAPLPTVPLVTDPTLRQAGFDWQIVLNAFKPRRKVGRPIESCKRVSAPRLIAMLACHRVSGPQPPSVLLRDRSRPAAVQKEAACGNGGRIPEESAHGKLIPMPASTRRC